MTLTTVAVVAFGDYPAVRVNVTSSPSVTDRIQVWRTHEDGTTWRVLTEPNPVIVGSWVGFDYHAPFNQPVTYYAQAGGLTSAVSAPVWVLSDSVWIIHASDPTLSVMVEKITTLQPYTYGDRATEFVVLNRQNPVLRTDSPRGGETGELTVKCSTPEQRAGVKALLADNGAVLLNTPFTVDDIGWKWVRVKDMPISNPGGYIDFPSRYIALSYSEVDPPDADAFPVWSAGQLKAAYATAGAAKAAYSSAQHMKLNVVG